MVPFVCGKLVLDLPNDLTKTDTLAIVIYTGLFRYGQDLAFDFSYDGRDQQGFGEQTGVSFKGVSSNQRITFRVLSHTRDQISGRYTSAGPADEGTFCLRPRR